MQQQTKTDLEGRKPAAWPVAQAYATGKKELKKESIQESILISKGVESWTSRK